MSIEFTSKSAVETLTTFNIRAEKTCHPAGVRTVRATWAIDMSPLRGEEKFEPVVENGERSDRWTSRMDVFGSNDRVWTLP